MPDPIAIAGGRVDLGRRVQQTATVAGSPALAAETTIATLTITDDLVVTTGVLLEGWGAFTVGTSGTAATLKLHRTNAAGATLASTGALTVVAANLVSFSLQGIDTAPVLPGQIYILTLQITGGAAVSTVSGVQLVAIVV